jgi:hypothetical protein
MPRQKSLLTVIRDLVQQEVRSAIQSLLGTISPGKTKPKNGRRRRRGPGRPPGLGRSRFLWTLDKRELTSDRDDDDDAASG